MQSARVRVAYRVAASSRKVESFVRQLLGPHLRTWAW